MLSNNSSFVNPSYNSSSFNNSSKINSSINNGLSSMNDNLSAKSLNCSNNERTVSVKTQQLNLLKGNNKNCQIIRNHSSRSIGGRIAGRNPLYSQSSLPIKYDFETPGQAMKLNKFASTDQLSNSNEQIDHNLTNNQSNSNVFSDQSNNQLNDQIYDSSNDSTSKLKNQQTFQNSTNQTSRPKLVYQPRSNETDNSTSTYQFNEKSDSIKEDNTSVAEKFKSNYEKFLEISRSIDFEEKLINLQLNKSKLKASARTSALLAGFAMVSF